MTDLPEIENGLAKVASGEWLMASAQPVATRGTAAVRGQKGLFVPDRGVLRRVATSGEAWCGVASRPFLACLTALPDENLSAVSAKVLLAPLAARTEAKVLRIVPMSFRAARCVTRFRRGWVVFATKSRVRRVAVADGETLNVRPEALVAWTGRDPTGSCPKLSVLDLFLPRGPKNLTYAFHGPSVVWFEGGEGPSGGRRRR